MPVERICANPTCVQPFLVPQWQIDHGGGKYCSNACRGVMQSLHKRVECICQNCGSVFTIIAYKAKKGLGKYCSPECQYRGFEKRITVECLNPQCRQQFEVIEAVVRRGKGKFCSRACFAEYREGETSLAERFWPLVQVCEHGLECIYCCWPWQGRRNQYGYGSLGTKVGERWGQKIVHRLAWEILNKQTIPDHLGACHHCDFPPCCNGMHIYSGTQKQNMQDAVRRDRMNHVVGESNGKAKLTASDIPRIWAMRNKGMIVRLIAEEIGVSHGTIDAVLHYRTWSHVTKTLLNVEQF